MRFTAVVTLAVSLATTAQNPAPGAQAPARTGLIVGQVIEAGSNRPVPEAIVSLSGTGPAIDPRDRGRRVMADSEGRFFFGELSAGTYSLRAQKAGYPQSFYGSRQPPLGGADPGSIQLAEGERRGDATIVLWKYATLSGIVVDEAGEPVVGVDVRALRRSFSGGRLRFIPLNTMISSARTDDRGAFRLASLLPGSYIVAVVSSQTTMPLAVFDQTTRQGRVSEEVMSAIPEFQILGSAQNQRIGGVVLMTRSGVAIPPAPAESGRLAVYPTTFHPSTAAAADATVFSVGPGEERSAGTIQLRPVPSLRVSGRLIGPSGPVTLTALRLSPVESLAEAALDPVTGLSDQTGAFTLLGVPPGQYELRVMTPRISGGVIPPSTPEKPILWASERVTVGDADVRDLAIALRPTSRVSGRVEFLGSKPGPTGTALSEAVYINIYAATGQGLGAATSPDPTGTFATGVPTGPYFVAAEDFPFPGWYFNAALFEGRDISDAPVEIKGDISGVVIQFSDDVSEIAGTVRNAKGAAESTGSVVVFPTDRQRWSGYGSRFSRRARSTSVSLSGAFAVKALPAGDYFVAAIPDTLLDGWQDPKTLAALSRTATRVSLAENEKRSVDLTRTVAR
jgi:carboxypeptidase family protein